MTAPSDAITAAITGGRCGRSPEVPSVSVAVFGRDGAGVSPGAPHSSHGGTDGSAEGSGEDPGRAHPFASGGGFFFDLLHCDTCGGAKSVGHQELGDIHLRFVKGLPGPYAVARSKMDRRIQREYPGEPLTRAEHHAAAEATLDPCRCGGRFRYDAPARCPECRSTSEQWDRDPEATSMVYD